jgi:hypothetical protein
MADSASSRVLPSRSCITPEYIFDLPRRDPDPALGAAWERIGKRNPWIRTAHDPPFTATSARMCESRYELRKWLEYGGNWSNGTAFAVEQDPGSPTWTPVLCFAQQGECSDEWLAIKSFPDGRGGWEHVAFESFSLHHILTRRPGSITSGHEASSGNIRYFNAILDGLFAATPQQCRDLDYPHPSCDREWEDTWPSQLAAARQHEDDLRAEPKAIADSRQS